MPQLNATELKELKKQLQGFKKDPNYKRVRNTPMAKLFGEIVNYIDGYDDSANRLDMMYKRLPMEERGLANKRQAVVKKLLDYLLRIHKLSLQKGESKFISIPLYDIKTMEKLVNILVVEGVYTALPDGVGIPLGKRRLKSFRIPVTIAKLPFQQAVPILQNIVDTMIQIFSEKSDLRDLIQVGTGYTDALTCAMVLAIDPNGSGSLDSVKKLEDSSATYQLVSLYTVMLASSGPASKVNALSARFRGLVLSRLSSLIVERKTTGVQATIDVVMGLRDNDKIDTTRIPHVVRALLSSKPPKMDNAVYFANIMGQLYDLLVFVNRPVMTTIAAAVVEIIFSKNSNIVKDFLFQKAWDAFNPPKPSDDRIILTTESQLNNAFNVILSLSRQSTSQEFSQTFFRPLIVPLWAYLLYQSKHGKDSRIVEDTLVSIISLDASPDYPMLTSLVDNLMALKGDHWELAEGDNKLTLVKESLNNGEEDPSNLSLSLLDGVDASVEKFVSVLRPLASSDSAKFNHVLVRVIKKWLKLDSEYQTILEDDDDPFEALTNLKLVHALIDQFKDSISSSPESLLKLVVSLLNRDAPIAQPPGIKLEQADSDDEDEYELSQEQQDATQIALDLLSTVVGGMTGNLTEEGATQLKELDSILSGPQYDSYGGLRDQVKSILSKTESSDFVDAAKQQEEDRLMEKAMKSIADPVPSVRAYGMSLVRQLADPSVGKVSAQYAIDLHVRQLKDKDPFVYLNAIKGLEELLVKQSSAAADGLLKLYKSSGGAAAGGDVDVDERLRIGEALLRYIQKGGITIPSATVDSFFETLIYIVGIRGQEHEDFRVRMSAMSLIGVLANQFINNSHIPEVVDLIEGILTFERDEADAPMRRSAITAINDLVTANEGLAVVAPYGEKLEASLKYIAENDDDLLVREQAKGVLYTIQDAFDEHFERSVSLA